MRKRPQRVVPLVLLALVLAAIAGLTWYRSHGGKGGGGPGGVPALPVMAQPVMQEDVPIYLDGIGTVHAYYAVTVKSRVDGELLEVLFKEGQDVKAGDVLARLDRRLYQAQYDQAVADRDQNQAKLDAARLDLARYIGLGDRVSGQTVDTQRATVRELEAAVKAGQAAIASARTELDYTTITAPISGRVGLRLIDPGNIVRSSDSTGIVMVTQIQPIAVQFTVPQQKLRAIADAMGKSEALTALAVDSDGKTVVDEGRLEVIDNQINESTGTVTLKAVFPNQERHLWPGGFTDVRLRLSVRKDGLVIPAPALQRGPQGLYVYVVKPDDTVEMRNVSVAVIEDGRALMDDGLKAGETVVVDGMARLRPGAKVRLAGETGKSGE